MSKMRFKKTKPIKNRILKPDRAVYSKYIYIGPYIIKK